MPELVQSFFIAVLRILVWFLHDPKVILQDTSANATKADRVCDSLPRRAGYCKRTKTLTPITKTSKRRTILYKNAAIHLSCHSTQIIQIFRMHNRRMPEPTFSAPPLPTLSESHRPHQSQFLVAIHRHSSQSSSCSSIPAAQAGVPV
jgi:hypothetical protein